MGKKTPLSPASGGGSRRDDSSGGQLLRELEALSQVLYNAGQQRPPRKETPSSPAFASLPGPARRSHEASLLSPHLTGRAPPSPYLGSRDSPSEDPPRRSSPYLGARNAPPSPFLAPQPEPRSPVIVSLNASAFGRSGAKPPRVEPLYELPESPQILVRRSVDSVSSPYIEGRRGLPRSPHSNARSRRSDGGSPFLGAVSSADASQLGRIDESNGMPSQSPQGYLGRAASQETSKSLGSLNITELTLSSAAAALRSPIVPVPKNNTRSFSPLTQSADSGKRIEPYSLGGGRESSDATLKPWHSQGFEKTSLTPEVAVTFPESNVQLEAPKEKRSLWNWKPFRAIAHIGASRFNCMFTVHVHGIEGLPAVTNGLRLAVSWKRKELQAQSMPARVFQGAAEFEESLYLKSTVYGTKDGSKGIKFEPKCFDLAVIALDVDELVLGKHRLDLSRLVPKDGRDGENDRSWTTRFKLAGKAKGGTLIVTFACQLLNKNGEFAANLSSARFSDSPMMRPLRSYNSLPSSPDGTSRSGQGAATAFFSPAMSEMPIDGEYMRMEHLSLNDEFSPNVESMSRSSQKGQTRPSFSDSSPNVVDFNPGNVELAYNQQAAFSERADMRKALSFDDNDDDGSEFTVVCQGHESSAIMDAAPSCDDDPKAHEDTVQGLLSDPEDDSLQPDSVDASEVVKFSSDEKVSREDQASDEATSEFQVAEESGSGDPEVEVEHKSEVDNVEEEDVVDVQEDWSVSVVEDLDDLTKSWAVGVPASNVAEEHETCRQDSDKEEPENDATEESTTNYVEESGYEETTNQDENEEDDEVRVAEEDLSIETTVESTPMKNDQAQAVEEDDYDLVYGEFLSLLRDPSPPMENSESGEDSPRAQLLKQFEQEALIEGGLELNFHLPEYAKFRVEGAQPETNNNNNNNKSDTVTDLPLVPDNVTDDDLIDYNSDWENEDDMELAAIIEAAEAELEKATQILQSKARAKLLEDEETKALMQEWGLNDRAFEDDAAETVNDLSMAIVPVAAGPSPPLGNGLGPVLRLCDGGSVRSMSPAHFQGEAGGAAPGRLLMQASNPVVVPSEMGATSMDILRRMAVAGMEGMAAQAVMAMPLEDLTGKPLDQIPVEQRPTSGFTQPLGSHRHGYGAAATLGHGEPGNYNNNNTTTLALRENGRSTVTPYRSNKWNGSGGAVSSASEDQLHMGLEDLAPMAMLKIEALALEGLKVQAEMAEQDAPYAVEPLADESNRNRMPALLKSGRPRRNQQGDFMTMDEWMRRHEDDDDDDDEEQHTVATQSSWNRQKQAHSRGFMDDTVTLAMLVHLRDPLCNNEPVGAPMMALVQAERVTHKPPGRPRVSSSSRRSFSAEPEKSVQDEDSPQFKIVDITIAGLRTSTTTETTSSTSSTPIWGTQKQLAAGSRWLAAHGMAKSSSRGPSNSFKSSSKPAAAAPRSALWSLSDRVYGSGARWRGAAHPHIQNPDVLFADTGIRTF